MIELSVSILPSLKSMVTDVFWVLFLVRVALLSGMEVEYRATAYDNFLSDSSLVRACSSKRVQAA